MLKTGLHKSMLAPLFGLTVAGCGNDQDRSIEAAFEREAKCYEATIIAASSEVVSIVQGMRHDPAAQEEVLQISLRHLERAVVLGEQMGRASGAVRRELLERPLRQMENTGTDAPTIRANIRAIGGEAEGCLNDSA